MPNFLGKEKEEKKMVKERGIDFAGFFQRKILLL
jgi:hypothetical protein